MKSPKVSVIVPIYNVEPYLDRCLCSLIGQSLTDIEIILVDDGSPDGCPRICDEYARRDLRIKVIHKANEGLGAARNTGLDIAVGEYVAFIDSDDYISAETYEVLYKNAQEKDADIVYGGLLIQKSDGSESPFFKLNKVFDNKESITDFLRLMLFDTKPYEERIWMSVCNGLYRRELIKRYSLRFLSERCYLSEDILFHAQFVPLCKKIVCLPYTFYHYCYNGSSLTHSFSVTKIESNFRLYETLLQISQQYHLPELGKHIQLLFINYTRGIILKGIILSDMTWKDKYTHCYKVYTYGEWENIFQSLHHTKIPFLEKLGLYLIRYKAFLLTVIIYYIYYLLLGRGKCN